MKFFSALTIFLLVIVLPQAHAQQDSDNQYIAIYGEIQQADLLGVDQPQQALAAYIKAQSDLQKFQKTFPDWNQKIVNYRVRYLAEKIAALSAQLPSLTNAPAQTELATPKTNSSAPVGDISSQLDALRAQVQNLQSDNATLQAKLKEALSIKPATVDSDELAKAQEQILSLMKQNDLLKASQSQTSTAIIVTNIVKTSVPNTEVTNLQVQIAALRSQAETDKLEKITLENRINQLQSPVTIAPSQPSNDARVAELTNEINSLRARLAVDEAPAVPYTPEETALLKQPEPKPATNSVPEKKLNNKLPAGSEALVAEAQNYFAAKQYEKAAEDYRKILTLAPDNALALGNLATIELQQGKLDDGETHVKAALAQSPNDAYDLSILGYLKFRQGKFDDALDALSRAAKLDPQNPEILNYLGVTLSHKGLRAQAETALRKALEIDPNYGPAHNNLAVIYISDQPPAPELARFHYQKALDDGQPRNPELEKLLADKGVPVNPQ